MHDFTPALLLSFVFFQQSVRSTRARRLSLLLSAASSAPEIVLGSQHALTKNVLAGGCHG